MNQSGRRSLAAGERVSFDIGENERGSMAVNVSRMEN